MIVVTPDQVIASRYTARPAVETAKRLGVHVLDLDEPNTIDAMRQEMDPWNVTLFHRLGSLSFETRPPNLPGAVSRLPAAWCSSTTDCSMPTQVSASALVWWFDRCPD
jgi:hypothetical protein